MSKVNASTTLLLNAPIGDKGWPLTWRVGVTAKAPHHVMTVQMTPAVFLDRKDPTEGADWRVQTWGPGRVCSMTQHFGGKDGKAKAEACVGKWMGGVKVEISGHEPEQSPKEKRT